ncbi:MAG: tandem-95 repeat protein [Nitrosarchaeum sp.]|nr:tandem-95 repeat protein [Nitrosarchaeum sp.]
MQKLSGFLLLMILISGAFSSSFAFAQIGPIAVDDSYSVNEDSILTVAPLGVLLNDTNIDSDIFAIIQTNVGFGTLTLNLDGSFTYQPNQNFDSIDYFTYVATNGTHNSNSTTVTLFVNPINDSPIARDDITSTFEDTPVTIPVLNNDSDVDGDLLTVNSITQGTNGTVTTNGITVTYTPKLDFNGIDSFIYTISDGILTDNTTVYVTVGLVNDAPIAQNDTASTIENTPIIIPVLNNDSDVDDNLLIINSITQGSNGTITTNSTTITYTPHLNFTGTDSFIYTISDGVNTSNSAMVTVIVTSVDDESDEEHNDKVNICHKDKKTISVSENAIPAHLKHGDVLGVCSNEHDDDHDGKHDDEHDEITNEKALQNEIKTLKKEFKAQIKDLKKQHKDTEKNLKNQLKELKKEKKSQNDKDDD